jgi:hypothetical protein
MTQAVRSVLLEVLSPEEERIFSAILFAVKKVLPPILIPFGLVGNFLAFLVLRQAQYAKVTSCFYMRVLAVFDSITLLSHVTIRTMINYYPRFMLGLEAGPVVCPLLGISVLVYSLSNWTIAAMTFDRVLAVRFPLKAAAWCTMKRCKFTVVGIVIIFLCFAIPSCFRTHNPSGLITTQICWFDPATFPESKQGVFNISASAFAYTTPFITVLVLNIAIVFSLIQERIRKTKDKMCTSSQKDSNKDGHITILLLLVTMIFFVTNIPWTCDFWLWSYVIPEQMMTSRLVRIRKLSYECSVAVLFINPSVNFYMYCFGCQKFRNDVRSTYRSCLKKGNL